MYLSVPTPAVPAPSLRVDRVVTVDQAGVRKSWTPAALAKAHPDLFAVTYHYRPAE